MQVFIFAFLDPTVSARNALKLRRSEFEFPPNLRGELPVIARSSRNFSQVLGQFPVMASPAKAFFTKGVESTSEPLTVPE